MSTYQEIGKAAGWELVSNTGSHGYFTHAATGRVVGVRTGSSHRGVYTSVSDSDGAEVITGLWYNLFVQLTHAGFNLSDK